MDLSHAMSQVRIAYFSNFSPKKLGTGENRLVAFARAVRARGHSLTIFGRRPIHTEVQSALNEAGADWASLDEVAKRPLRSSRRLARDFDVIQLNMIAPRSAGALAAYLAFPCQVLFVDRVSGPVETDGDGSDSGAGAIGRALDRVTMIRVAELAGITDYVSNRLVERFGVDKERVVTIYNGVDATRFHPPAEQESGPELRIVVVAALIREKGVDVLLRALAGMRTDMAWRLSIVGEGHQRAVLEKLAGSLCISPRVSFLGLRDDVPELMKNADIVVHPAIWQEALGNTVLEGMACGRCVIASRVGGIPELIRDGQDGMLFDAGDSSALLACLRQAGSNPGLRQRLGQSARQRVVDQFSLEQSISAHLDWCERIASRTTGEIR